MGIPVAANTAAQTVAHTGTSQATETRLTGRWLIAARGAWFALAALMLTVFIAGLIASLIHVNMACPTPACEQAPLDANLRNAAAGAGLHAGSQSAADLCRRADRRGRPGAARQILGSFPPSARRRPHVVCNHPVCRRSSLLRYGGGDRVRGRVIDETRALSISGLRL